MSSHEIDLGKGRIIKSEIEKQVAAFDGQPTTNVNHFTIMSNPEGSIVRIAFGEMIVPNIPIYSYAAAMPVEICQQLVTNLMAIIDNFNR